eukprot:3232-Eustigmatos_ZCMA.PRE.1
MAVEQVCLVVDAATQHQQNLPDGRDHVFHSSRAGVVDAGQLRQPCCKFVCHLHINIGARSLACEPPSASLKES